MELDFSRHIFVNTRKLQIATNSVQWDPSFSIRTDGQTDKQTDKTKQIVVLHKFWTAPISDIILLYNISNLVFSKETVILNNSVEIYLLNILYRNDSCCVNFTGFSFLSGLFDIKVRMGNNNPRTLTKISCFSFVSKGII